MTSPQPDRAPAPAPAGGRSPHQAEPPAELRQRFHEGDPDAAAQLAESFFGDVFRFARSLLPDEESAIDAVQETFLRLLERHALYRPASPFRPWLFGVCRNTCLFLRRTEGRRAARVIELDPSDFEIEALASELPTAFEATLRAEEESHLLAALDELEEAKRSIILLHLFEELTFREIGELLGRSPNTVATTYYRTLRDLRARLAPVLGGNDHDRF